MAATRWVSVPLVAREDGLWFGRLDDEETPPGAQLWLGVQTSRIEAASEVPQVAKTSSWGGIADVVGGADAGLALSFEAIPGGGPPNEPATWFRLVQSGPHWEEVAGELTFAMYLPPPYDPESTTVLLYADGETIVGLPPRPKPPFDLLIG